MGCSELADACLSQRVAAATRQQVGNSSGTAAELREQLYESAWRAGQWEEPGSGGPMTAVNEAFSSLKEEAHEPGFQEMVAKAVASLAAGESSAMEACLEAARVREVAKLAGSGIQSAAALSESVVRLQMAGQLASAWAVRWPAAPLKAFASGRPNGGPSLQKLQVEWAEQRREAEAGGRFALMEPLVAFNSVLLQLLGSGPEAVVAVQVDGARAARKAGQLSYAGTAMARIQAAVAAQAGGEGRAGLARPDSAWRLEDLKVMWAEGHWQLALELAQGLARATDKLQAPDVEVAAQVRSLAAQWLAAQGGGSPNDILNGMKSACGLAAEAAAGPVVGCRVHFRLAEYAFKLYGGAVKQQGSRESAVQVAVLRAKQDRVLELEKQARLRNERGQIKKDKNGNLDYETRVLYQQLNRQRKEVKLDQAEVTALEQNKQEYLLEALQNYGRVLVLGTKYNLMAVFRLCNLWFKLEDAAVTQKLQEVFTQAPSYKFVTLVYQMASRMSSSRSGPRHDSGFHRLLQSMMRTLAVDHPYHTLYQIFALKNGNRAGRQLSQQVVEHQVDEDKVAAAQALVDSLRKDPAVCEIVAQMETLLEAYIALANVPAAKKADVRAPDSMYMPRELRTRFKDLHLMPLISFSVPLRPDKQYVGTFPHIESVSEHISFVGGINMPKLIKVYDSNRAEHRELVKSKDDLRQDAVMQQLFALVNELLLQDEASRTRQLSIATYKVVPFTPDSGLLAWVEDTMPLAEYLIGRDYASGAHHRYRAPSHYTHRHCQKAMSDARRKGTGLRRIFDDICQNFFPVMHNFFLEMYRHPSEWFERRLAYTRSVAVNSMVGYIIGLGDRHSSNILLKLHTAEVVHIDLGIAFEQGRLLQTPEQVPFRLTRDIVHSMGVAGCNGVMRRCSEAVLRVLRAHREQFLTIAEVLIHDPLFNWALTPKKAAQHQRGAGSHKDSKEAAPEDEPIEAVLGVELGNVDAERALTRVRQKLEGTEQGDGEPHGVEGQVQQLLQDAQDPDKLCRMYEGWAAWL
mmetsp:Transcript_4049/g.11433  ORF Transcript_4049/g.11433 Transcript_4049/m.11433 type:complete len:1027 (+) Transcript_4049:606-3686(+)